MTEKKHSRLWLYFSGIVFATIMAGFLVILALWFLLFNLDIISVDPMSKPLPIIWLLAASCIIGTMVTVFVGKLIIEPVQHISEAFRALSTGNFSIRVPENEKIAEIRDMARNFNDMASDLSQIEMLRTDFVVNVSHEFKTPIASIEGYVTLLQGADLSDEKRSRYIEKILDNSARLSNLLTNILELSKLENQEKIFNKTQYRMDEQLRKCVILLENKWSAKNIEFDIEMSKKLYYGCEPLLDQVWFNIIDNAIKHSAENGIIKIRLFSENSEIIVVISDSGSGMSAEVQKHIFEKFYQGDNSRKSEGNGLGLALVKRIVDLCDGKIIVRSEINCGTEFKVVLPNISDSVC